MSLVEVRMRRRRSRAGGIVVALSLAAALVGGLVWVWRAGVLNVTTIVVLGAQRTDPAAVQGVASTTIGEPLPLVDTELVADRVRDLPLVLDAGVRRSWPDTVTIEITERVGVAAVPSPSGVNAGVDAGVAAGVAAGIDVVDVEGVVLESVATPPAGLPLIDTDVSQGTAGLVAALDIVANLPDELAVGLSAVSARSPADVRLVIAGKDVRWGTADQGEAKAAVLSTLMAQVDAQVYDVSAPASPATRS